ncbi:MAG: hypothetical protein WA989_06775 [Henriciella sp.]|uniref:hypothetical protein n=1 Tax=Henriciella sp. TaxID=1968823 RepID=UPI003C7666ED
MSRTTLIAIFAGVTALLLAGWGVALLWIETGVTMTMHGWIAYALGGIASLALSIGLFWLLFHSAREGHDDLDRPEELDG